MNKYLFVFSLLFLLTSSNVFAEKEIIISDDKLYSISNLTKKINSAFNDEDYEKVDFYLNKIISKYPEKKELISSYQKKLQKATFNPYKGKQKYSLDLFGYNGPYSSNGKINYSKIMQNNPSRIFYEMMMKKGKELNPSGKIPNMILFSSSDSPPLSYFKSKFFHTFDEAFKNPLKVYKIRTTQKIPPEIKNLKNLEELEIIQNGINNILLELDSIPIELSELPNLKSLRLGNNNLKKLGKGVENSKSLKKITIGCYNDFDLDELFSSLYKIKNLEELDLSCLNINYLPENMDNFKKLKVLSLSFEPINKNQNNGFIKLSKIENLNSLSLYNVVLNKSSSEIGRLSKINKLELSVSYVENLPDEFYDLINLNKLTLVLFNSKLTNKEYAKVFKLKNLEKLRVRSNNFESLRLPHDIVSNIKELDLSYNNLGKFPFDIFKLNKLEVLDLSNTRLKTISLSDNFVSNIKKLDLSSNNLDKFPLDILKMTSLETLNLFNNNISEIPKDIVKLKNLKKLILSTNPISFLPSSLSKIKNLDVDVFNTNMKDY